MTFEEWFLKTHPEPHGPSDAHNYWEEQLDDAHACWCAAWQSAAEAQRAQDCDLLADGSVVDAAELAAQPLVTPKEKPE
jgi:hypothetical protein